MPRHRRVDIPGAIHHVIIRGLERRQLFCDDTDRSEFLTRLEKSLEETQCRCYAWTLMPNHIHLLIRTGKKSLSDLMRKVLTGYAIYFNRRHRRHGYLYQNRYHSILCQEEVYFLELVRYIHLNPIRVEIIKGLEELDRYPWTGHSVLVGQRKREWQSTEEILSRFNEKKKRAVAYYREFIQKGIGMGKRPEFIGGGLKRSVKGWSERGKSERERTFWRGDERILGDANFVSMVLKSAEEEMERKEKLKRDGWNLERLVATVCHKLSVHPDELRKKGRINNRSIAKGMIAYWGYNDLGINGNELARFLRVSRPAVSKIIARGEEYIKKKDLKLPS